MALVQIIASTAPAAPSKCPMLLLLELIITFLDASPNAVFIAIVSVESFKCVDVPCALI